MARDAALKLIRAEIVELADPARAERVRHAVPGARTNGAPVPRLRDLAKRVHDVTRRDAFPTACRLMDALCRSGVREEFLVGTFIVGRHQRDVKTLPWTRVRSWLAAVDNWETCDQLAAEVLATMANARPVLRSRLATLARSRDQWQRRLAVATAASLNQRGRSQPGITRAICAQLADDEERMIRQAVTWARRELAKTERKAGLSPTMRS